MTSKELIRLRLSNQWITRLTVRQTILPSLPFTPADVVAHLGAMQAQDYAMAKWAVGLRMDNATHDNIEQAIDKGQILRTHVLRPTWHLVHPKDIRWMLALSAPRIRAAMATQQRQLQLDEKIFRRSEKLIEKALAKDQHLTRTELMTRLQAAGIATNDIRSSHIMIRAELNGLVCNGPRAGKQFTYALLEERVPPAPKLSRDESIAQLAQRYFTSHGPATVHDFAWWSGLSVTDAKKGIESNSAKWQSITLGSQRQGATNPQKYWFITPPAPPIATASPTHTARPSASPAHTVLPAATPLVRIPSAFLLPAFDELLVSYADRSALLDPAIGKQIITNNGLFYPTILANGKIAGTWTRIEKPNKITIHQNLIHPVSKTAEKAITTACNKYSKFIGK